MRQGVGQIELKLPAARVVGEIRSRIGGLEVHPRPMRFQRRLHPGLGVGCPSRLNSKLYNNGAPLDPHGLWRLSRRWWSTETFGSFE